MKVTEHNKPLSSCWMLGCLAFGIASLTSLACGPDTDDSDGWWDTQDGGATGGMAGAAGDASGGSPATGGHGGTGADSGSGGAGGTGASAGAGGAPPMPSDALGFWVWKKVVKDGVVSVEVTEEDLEFRVGSSGWPGCPIGILCSHYGVQRFDLRDTGQYFYGKNVTTGSDYNQLGTFAASSDTLTFTKTEDWSCAHPPGGSAGQSATGYARYKVEAGDLWVGMASFADSFASEPPTVDPATWVVFRRVSEQDFYGKYNVWAPEYHVTVCQASSCASYCASSNIPF